MNLKLHLSLPLKISVFMAFFVISLVHSNAYGQLTQTNISPFDRVVPAKANKDLQVFVYSYQHAVAQNYAPENDFLKGQIVGRLFGANTTTTSNAYKAMYVEQRVIPFFVYSPKIFDGKATIRAAFEIDWTWGDVAYGTGGNSGSAISADQVNLQTQNLVVEYRPAKYWYINVGLQRMFDTPHDVYRTLFDKFTTTGYRLAFWGTDGVGLTVRRETDRLKLKSGYYKLYENNVELNDDVTLFELIGQYNVAPNWNVGASLYYNRDRSGGKGGVSILGQGFASPLANYNGTYRFPLSVDPYHADIVWLGAFFNRNEEMMQGRYFLSGFINANFGAISQQAVGQVDYHKTVSIAGVSANLRTGYRYGQTVGDAVSVDVIYSSGNKGGIDDGKYTGVVTGNTWGSPASIFIGHGGYLIFPHGNVVNRFVGAVTDLSNMGYGVMGGTFNIAKDIIPHKLHSKIGGALALSNVAPVRGGNFVGWEANAKIGYDLGAFMSIEAHAAYMGLGDFYDSSIVNGGVMQRPVNPWLAFISYKWLIF